MAELKKIIVDGVEHTLPEGGGGSSNYIIEVENLPTENIDESAIYKLHTLNIYIATTEDIMPFEHMFGTPTFTVIVDTLPATGETVTQADKVILYYSKEANAIYGYLDDETASSLGGSAGWYPADMLLTALLSATSYAGIFPSFNDIIIQEEGTFTCAAWVYLFYIYKDGQFTSFKPDLPIYRGEGNGSVIFSDPFWSSASGGAAVALGNETRASGDCSLAGGFGTYAQGQYSFAFGNNPTAGGDYSHAEGSSTNAGGKASHAEGQSTTASGNYSHAEGHSTQATTTSAHAEGFNTRATHIASHAEGEDTVASGSHSHSEGYGTAASGETQHVQGRYNITDANNKYAHIVGNGTGPGITGTTGDIKRSNAHTLDWEGNAWFKGNVRVGGTSWDDATELGSGSGSSQVFVDVDSLPTENINSDVIYRLFTVYGIINGTPQTNTTVHIVDSLPTTGENCTTNGSTFTNMYYNTTDDSVYGYVNATIGAAFGVPAGWYPAANLLQLADVPYGGIVDSTVGLESGKYYFVREYDFYIYKGKWIKLDNDIVFQGEGLSSVVMNDLGNVASGDFSYAEGESTTASGRTSHAEGVDTIASGRFGSHAEGIGTEASGGYGSHAEGQHSIASGEHSHAEGYHTTASGEASHAEGGGGTYTIAHTFTRTPTQRQYTSISTLKFGVVLTDRNGTYATIIAVSGTESPYTYTLDKDFVTTEGETVTLYQASGVASGYRSHAEGSSTTASGNSSHAEGSSTTASGSYSHAEGSNTTASSSYSHAEGYVTTASGMYSHAEGYGAIASGEVSHAEGHYTTASGHFSHAEGEDTIASGSRSHTEGSYTEASGGVSHAEGLYTIASGEHQHVQGKYNTKDPSNKYAHIVGNGTSTSARSNAHTLDWNGNAWYKGNIKTGGTTYDDAPNTVVTSLGTPTDSGQILIGNTDGTAEWSTETLPELSQRITNLEQSGGGGGGSSEFLPHIIEISVSDTSSPYMREATTEEVEQITNNPFNVVFKYIISGAELYVRYSASAFDENGQAYVYILNSFGNDADLTFYIENINITLASGYIVAVYTRVNL